MYRNTPNSQIDENRIKNTEDFTVGVSKKLGVDSTHLDPHVTKISLFGGLFTKKI